MGVVDEKLEGNYDCLPLCQPFEQVDERRVAFPWCVRNREEQ